LDRGEQSIRYYEMGRNRLPADDMARFADAYQMSRDERAEFIRLLGLIDDDEPISDEDQADLDAFLADPEIRLDFFSTVRDMRHLTTAEKRLILQVVRTTLALSQERER
jgi:hypothetical protein